MAWQTNGPRPCPRAARVTHYAETCHSHRFDVAAYILERRGPTPVMKLQVLVYYAQAWSLVWEEHPLYAERIEAWANGPVVPALAAAHRGVLLSHPGKITRGDPCRLDALGRDTVNAVLDFYGPKPPAWLTEQTQTEDPWLLARQGLGDRERGQREINFASMMHYYGHLRAQP
jgi:uncharacterized phage-associated protein